MAESKRTTTAGRKPAAGTARKPAGRKTATTRSTTRRSTSATTPAAARRARNTAANETREAVAANTRAAKQTASETRGLAERAALVYVGAALEARDRVLGTTAELVERYATISGAQQELKRVRRDVSADVTRFERRGVTARTQIERDAKKARTRLERELRLRRRRVQHDVEVAERKAERRPNTVTARIASVSDVVENAAQAGTVVAQRVIGKVTPRS